MCDSMAEMLHFTPIVLCIILCLCVFLDFLSLVHFFKVQYK